jgi:hypothetical protein
MMYVGMACATALIRVALPAKDRFFSFHPFSFFQILSKMNWNAWFFDLPICVGTPGTLKSAQPFA